ncbi:Smr/MutS family protein [Spirochaetia bacterium 38H-sp]|uniref:Endonuclease MutS2 n=1 Tax=Rarispira pelagica TaxID=3141764 RepID=A0ABU9UE40_9SPIR
MDGYAVESLEFFRVVDEVVSYAMSSEGAERLRGQGFFYSEDEIADELELVSEWRFLMEQGLPVSGAFPDIGEVLEAAQKPGMVLSLDDLCAVMLFFKEISRLRSVLVSAEAVERLRALAGSVYDFSFEYEFFSRYLEFPPAVREDALPELAEIRQSMRRISAEIERIASSYLKNPSLEGAFNSLVPTQREGRTVLAVVSSRRSLVKGIVHEVSDSGATCFIEPFEIVEQNNLLVSEQNRYKEVVNKLFAELTERLRAVLPELNDARDVLGRLDAAYAKARYGVVHDCVPASPGSRFAGKALRHPLLGSSCVPVDFEFDENSRICVLSGANAGGKTVFLKTLGLCVLMHQFGMEVPAGEGTVLPVCSSVHVALGDEQSLDNALSTFSAYAKRLAEILSACRGGELVLLDELGSGTDPQEGGALSVAVLEELRARGAFVLATTHVDYLKVYASSTPGVFNASVNFDERDFKPLFTITRGLPGMSYALVIARRMGVPDSVVCAAEGILAEGGSEFSALLRRVQERETELSELAKKLEEREKALAAIEMELAERLERVKERERVLRREGLVELRSFLAEVRREREALVKRLREAEKALNARAMQNGEYFSERKAGETDSGSYDSKKGDVGRDVSRGVYSAENDTLRFGRETGTAAVDSEDYAAFMGLAKRLEARLEKEEQALSAERLPSKTSDFSVGMRVIHRLTGRTGEIVGRDKKGWVVLFGSLKMVIPASDLRGAGESEKIKQESVKVLVEADMDSAVPQVLDVRGMRLEEALMEVSAYIERAAVAGLRELAIVHGTGAGVLQKGIGDFLRTNPIVESFDFARPEEGGFGKTLVHLKF